MRFCTRSKSVFVCCCAKFCIHANCVRTALCFYTKAQWKPRYTSPILSKMSRQYFVTFFIKWIIPYILIQSICILKGCRSKVLYNGVLLSLRVVFIIAYSTIFIRLYKNIIFTRPRGYKTFFMLNSAGHFNIY